MPFIGDAFFARPSLALRIRCPLELFRGLAQRNKGRKTSYFEGCFPKTRPQSARAVSEPPSAWNALRATRASAAAPVLRRLDPLNAKGVAAAGKSKNESRKADGQEALSA
jgi:hypothetical protein